MPTCVHPVEGNPRRRWGLYMKIENTAFFVPCFVLFCFCRALCVNGNNKKNCSLGETVINYHINNLLISNCWSPTTLKIQRLRTTQGRWITYFLAHIFHASRKSARQSYKNTKSTGDKQTGEAVALCVRIRNFPNGTERLLLKIVGVC